MTECLWIWGRWGILKVEAVSVTTTVVPTTAQGRSTAKLKMLM